MFGIWFFGPICILLGGGGFTQEGGWVFAIIATVLFPLFTLLLSVYDGTLGAVIFTTLGLLLLQLMNQTMRKNIPPSAEG